MGGRRARSLTEILGAGLGSQQASFTRSVARNDPENIAVSSAKLVAESEKISNILYYASKLSDFILKEAKSKQDLSYGERERLARKEWSRIKREEKINDDPVVTDAIVSAVVRALGKGRK